MLRLLWVGHANRPRIAPAPAVICTHTGLEWGTQFLFAAVRSKAGVSSPELKAGSSPRALRVFGMTNLKRRFGITRVWCGGC